MPRSLLATGLAVAAAASLGGCVSLLPKTKPSQLYQFGADAPLAASPVDAPSGAAKTGVVLGTIGFPRAATSDGILTVTGDQTAYISGVRWVAPARILFQEAVQRQFDRRAKQVQIVNVGDVGPAGAILRIDVTTFEARYQRSAPSPTVVISLVARLTRSDGRLLDQRDFSVLEPAGADRVSMIVKAFDRATDKILTDIAAWTDREVTAMGAVSPAEPPPLTPPPSPEPTVATSSSSTSTTTTSTTTPHP